MTKAPTPTEMSKGQSDNTNNATKKFDYTAIADRLRTASWSNYSHPTGVVNRFTGPPSHSPQQPCNQKDKVLIGLLSSLCFLCCLSCQIIRFLQFLLHVLYALDHGWLIPTVYSVKSKDEVYWQSRLPAEHKKIWRYSGCVLSHTVVRVNKWWDAAFPIFLFIRFQSS